MPDPSLNPFRTQTSASAIGYGDGGQWGILAELRPRKPKPDGTGSGLHLGGKGIPQTEAPSAMVLG